MELCKVATLALRRGFIGKLWLGLVMLLVASVAIPPISSGQQSIAQDKQMELGEAIVRGSCAACHALNSDQTGPHPQAPSLARLAQSYPVALLAEALAEGIMTGHADMPVFEFDAESVDHIITYLESIQID